MVSGDGALTVAWSAPIDTGGSGIQSYDLRYIRSDAPDKADANWTVRDGVWSSGVLRYTLGGLSNGDRYDLQLRAVTSTGDGPGPRRLRHAADGAAGPGISSITPGDESLAAAWSAPSDDGGSAITGYGLRYIRSDARTRPTPTGLRSRTPAAPPAWSIRSPG